MLLPRSRAIASVLEFLDETPSTNDVVSLWSDAPDFAVVVTTHQTAGRGRLGRVWTAPPGASLAASVLLRPTLPAGEPLAAERYSWIPLIAGLAMASAVEGFLPGARVSVKWPNDVLVDERKISGILAELRSFGGGVIVGAGVNLGMSINQLPVPTATSLGVLGVANANDLVDDVLGSYLSQLRARMSDFLSAGGDADAAGIRAEAFERCSTVGKDVRVELPGADDVVGSATDIDRSGRLVVIRASDGHRLAVAAGDVTHLRYE